MRRRVCGVCGLLPALLPLHLQPLSDISVDLADVQAPGGSHRYSARAQVEDLYLKPKKAVLIHLPINSGASGFAWPFPQAPAAQLIERVRERERRARENALQRRSQFSYLPINSVPGMIGETMQVRRACCGWGKGAGWLIATLTITSCQSGASRPTAVMDGHSLEPQR